MASEPPPIQKRKAEACDAPPAKKRKVEEWVKSLTPDLNPIELYQRIEANMERLISWILVPVLDGIPALKVASVKDEAQRIVEQHGSAEAAVARVMETHGTPGLQKKLLGGISEFLVTKFLPLAGVSSRVLHTLYAHLRLAALIAEMRGHDTQDAEVKSMLLFCIAPDEGRPSGCDHLPKSDEGSCETSNSKSVAKNIAIQSTKALSHSLARQVLERATGWKTAADLYDLAARVCSESYKHARGSEEIQQADSSYGAIFRRATIVFKPRMQTTAHLMVIPLIFGSALPILASILRFAVKLVIPLFSMQLRAALCACMMTTIVCCFAVKVRCHIKHCIANFTKNRPQVLSSVVLLGHAMLPSFATFNASGMLLTGLSCKVRSTCTGDQANGAVLSFLLGVWNLLRLWQRCFAEPNSTAAKGKVTWQQQRIVTLLLSIGICDMVGPDGLQLHALIRFGVLRSHHWVFWLFSLVALECQLKLIVVLRDKETLLRLLGASRVMSLALMGFLGGLTASIGFVVSPCEMSKFMNTLMPPPKTMAVILALRKNNGAHALVFGMSMGVLSTVDSCQHLSLYWLSTLVPLLSTLVNISRCVGFVMIAGLASKMVFTTFQENHAVLIDPRGGRWLLLFPQGTEQARRNAMNSWNRCSSAAAGLAVSKGTQMLGKSIIKRALDYIAWRRPHGPSTRATISEASMAE